MPRDQTSTRWVERLEGASRLLEAGPDDPPVATERASAVDEEPACVIHPFLVDAEETSEADLFTDILLPLAKRGLQ